MGFAAREADPKARRGLLIAAAGGEAQGTDVTIHSADLSDGSVLEKLASGAIPVVGVEAPSLNHAGAAAAEEAGIDFLVFGVDNTTADALTRCKLDYVLRLDNMPSESELRALGTLRPQFVIVPNVKAPVTLARALELRQITMMAGAPLGASVASDIDLASLTALRESGVAVLILQKPSAAAVEELAECVAAMPERTRRERDGEMATLPSATGFGADDEEDGDEDRLQS